MKTKTLLLIAIALLLITVELNAKNYYVSGIGNDLNSGTVTAQPWLTIGKLNAAALLPGDSVFFRRGYTYRGQIDAKPGSSIKQIYYGAYGTGAAPIISGSLPIANTGWTVYSGNIYVKSNVFIPSMSAAEPPVLYFNGQALTPARYPNYNTGFLTADNVTGILCGSYCCEQTFSLKHSALTGIFTTSTSLIGAHVTAYDPYGVSSRLINNYNPSTGVVDFDTLRGVAFCGEKVYFFSRKLNLLDIAGEWYYDDVAKKLYAYFPNGQMPSSSDLIEYSSALYGFNSYQVPYNTIRDLEFRHQQIAGIHIIRSTNVEISNNKFYESKYGIHGWGSNTVALSGTKVLNNTFENIHRVAIDFTNNTDGALISDNVIRRTAMIMALMQSGQSDAWGNYGYWEYGLGIQFYGSNSTIIRNRIDSTGRQSIAAGGSGASVLIKNNVIDHPCINYNDCGGIMPLGNSIVDANIIKNAIPFLNSDQYIGNGPRGIYPDFKTGDLIKNNTIVNVVTGIGLTNSKTETVVKNTVYNASLNAFMMNRKNAGQLTNSVKNNIFFSLNHSQNSLYWNNLDVTIDNNSTLDSNRYWNPYSYYPVIKYHHLDTDTTDTWYDLGQWKNFGKDLKSKKEWMFKNIPYILKNTTNDSVVNNSNFSSGVTSWTATGSVNFTTVGGQLDGNCASVNYTGMWAGGNIRQNITKPIYKDSLYLITFSLKGTSTSNGERLEVSLYQTNNSSIEHFHRAFKTQLNRVDYKSVFKAKSNAPLTINIFAPNGLYYIDNIQVKVLHATALDPAKSFPIFVNETSIPMNVNLPPCSYFNLDSVAVGSSITLPPYSSQILVLMKDSCQLTLNTEEPTKKLIIDNLNVYPNPASSELKIDFNVSETQKISLEVFDLSGRQVLSLMETTLGAGPYSINMDASALQPGIYLVRYVEGTRVNTKKLNVIR